MSNVSCGAHGEEIEGCRDDSYALTLKYIAIGSILIAGACGVAIPLVGKKRRFLRTDSNLFVTTKAFAAGVILATGFVHMLPDATEALNDSCLPEFPWSKFPFSGFISMMAALATLLADFVGTQYYERKQERQGHQVVNADSADMLSETESGIVPVETRGVDGRVFGAEEGGAMHIVGMHAHAAHHGHSHSQEQGACAGHQREDSHALSHSHSHGIGGGDEEDGGARHVVVSQACSYLYCILLVIWLMFVVFVTTSLHNSFSFFGEIARIVDSLPVAQVGGVMSILCMWMRLW